MKQSDIYKRRTKIVCTIGPASESAVLIERLIRSGMNVARLNLSHGSFATHAEYVKKIRKISRKLEILVAILIDLAGPKYRTGRLKDGKATLRKSAQVTLTSRRVEGDSGTVPVNLPALIEDIRVGDTVLIDDGAMQLKALDKDNENIKCRVIVGGVLTDNRGLVVPGMHSSSPFCTENLREQLDFALKQDIDYIALSFVSEAADVSAVKEIIAANGSEVPVISKVERATAVRNFDAILEVSDGIMVARGDMGVNIPLEKVPLVQKEIIQKCNIHGKPVITATQMLESMVSAARPTRAEVTDISNAIFDGTDAIMLSAETSVGKYPVAAVRTMSKIARETERRLNYENRLAQSGVWIEKETDELISYSACHVAQILKSAAIVAFTHSGSTARRVSKYRPRVPVLAITPGGRVAERLLLHWGVYPFQIKEPPTIDRFFATAAELAEKTGAARKGDTIVITGGVPVGIQGSTNLLKVEEII